MHIVGLAVARQALMPRLGFMNFRPGKDKRDELFLG
jgi:hypothetical protein